MCNAYGRARRNQKKVRSHNHYKSGRSTLRDKSEEGDALRCSTSSVVMAATKAPGTWRLT